MLIDQDTICAIATAPGRGGIGIVRLSGPKARLIGEKICGRALTPRYAHFCDFRNQQHLDTGIAIFFPGPNSFTGEDTVEFQGHGGPILLDGVIAALVSEGVRIARPGEFSERAYLNGKLDLAQAEAIADLINASTQQAARGALQSLDGAFSKKINNLVAQLTHLRVYVEASIDFPEEEIDFLTDGKVEVMTRTLINDFNELQQNATQGALLRDGMTVVIAGRPNAGKSSLLNALTGRESAIVTDIAGTTRDVLHEDIHIDGMPLHIIDTAGLRNAPDAVEQEGIKRAQIEMARADHILIVIDSSSNEVTDIEHAWPKGIDHPPESIPRTVILNKVDIANSDSNRFISDHHTIPLSATTGDGIDSLREHLKSVMGYQQAGEGGFLARQRHVDAIERARTFVDTGLEQLLDGASGELMAEDLRMAQQALAEITGEFSSDDLLGEIFGSFCIGK